MDQIKKYLKSRKNPTVADRQLARAYDNYIKPKTAKELLDVTFTPEYQKFVRDFWNDCHNEFVKAQAAKKEYEYNLGLPPEEAANLRKAAEIKIKEQKRLSKNNRIKEEEAYRKDMAQYD